jgi:hypothetical protein
MSKLVDYKRQGSILEYWKELETDPLFEDYNSFVKGHPLLCSLRFLWFKQVNSHKFCHIFCFG